MSCVKKVSSRSLTVCLVSVLINADDVDDLFFCTCVFRLIFAGLRRVPPVDLVLRANLLKKQSWTGPGDVLACGLARG